MFVLLAAGCGFGELRPLGEKDDRRFFEAAFKEAEVEYNIVNAEGNANTQLNQAGQAINPSSPARCDFPETYSHSSTAV